MRIRLRIAGVMLAGMLSVDAVEASGPPATQGVAHPPKSVTPAAPAKTSMPPVKPAVSSPAPASQTALPARPETLEEIVARVRRRLALEGEQPRRGAAPAQSPTADRERVTLTWRPSVVWPGELAVSAPAAPATEPDRVSLSWETQPK